MKTLSRFLAVPILIVTLLAVSACSSKAPNTVERRIPNGEVITVKSATPERDLSLHVVADRDDYGQKDMEFYVSAESSKELHELVKENIGKKIRIEWSEGLISAAEELEGQKRFAGRISKPNDTGAVKPSSERSDTPEKILEEVGPIDQLEKQIAYGDQLNAVAANIATYSPKNLQILSACVFASNIYRKNIIPNSGERRSVELGSPSAADADQIHKILLQLVAGYKTQLDDNETFSALLSSVNDKALNYFFLKQNNDGTREINLKNWGNWYGVPLVSPCRNIVAPFLDEGVDPLGIRR